MARRIQQSIVRGEIDNRARGCVHGRLWLAGRGEPIVLELRGNCRRDLAGCLVTFVNPRAAAAADEETDLDALQSGVAGEITASRKVRFFDVPLEEALRITREGGAPAEHMANSLYLEWFSDANGRVVIESSDYTFNVSAPVWTLSAEEEQEEIETSHQALRDWLERLDQASEFDEPVAFDPEEGKPMDEFGYEKFMRESDVRTDKYMELLDKYEGHPDQEKIVAREMGWEWLEEALEPDERGTLPPREKSDDDLPPWCRTPPAKAWTGFATKLEISIIRSPKALLKARSQCGISATTETYSAKAVTQICRRWFLNSRPPARSLQAHSTAWRTTMITHAVVVLSWPH